VFPLRITLRLILGVDISFNDASSSMERARGGLPRIVRQFHAPQFLEVKLQKFCKKEWVMLDLSHSV
jgi:hypothetical protein